MNIGKTEGPAAIGRGWWSRQRATKHSTEDKEEMAEEAVFIRCIVQGDIRCDAIQVLIKRITAPIVQPVDAYALIVEIRRSQLPIEPRLEVDSSILKYAWIKDSCDV